MGIIDKSKALYRNPANGLSRRFKIAIEEINDGDDVLEIGVGWGELARHLGDYKKVDLYAVDVAESALQDIAPYVKGSQLADISLEKIRFEDNQFDAVVCLEVFEHLQNPYQALTEIQRVLKPGGKLILSIPNALGGHLMIYPGLMTQKFFAAFLRQNFFKIRKEIFWGPVWNKDNIGVVLQSKIKAGFMAGALLGLVQTMILILQFLTRILTLKVASLYWCYFFICENKKHQMQKPFWLKQLEQTSELGDEHPGWYNDYFHGKP